MLGSPDDVPAEGPFCFSGADINLYLFTTFLGANDTEHLAKMKRRVEPQTSSTFGPSPKNVQIQVYAQK